MEITALYASLLAPLFILLSARVIGARRSAKVAVGDGGNTPLLRRMRVHANFAEYVPFALLLMALAENLGRGRGLFISWASRWLPAGCLTPMASRNTRRCSGSVSLAWRRP